MYVLGPTMDCFRSASIFLEKPKNFAYQNEKNSENAMYLAENFEKDGLKINYPGFKISQKS